MFKFKIIILTLTLVTLTSSLPFFIEYGNQYPYGPHNQGWGWKPRPGVVVNGGLYNGWNYPPNYGLGWNYPG
ncbi:hypothetical protein FQR65_LT07664 [Abscondita terminalis]|nr:hypothetical protein FQR65_LT07664 [Abscondita terminalis]